MDTNKFQKAISTFGYDALWPTAVTDGQARAIDDAQQRARQDRVQVAQSADWAGLIRLFQSLRSLDVPVLGFRFEYILHLVVACLPHRGLELEAVTEYRRTFEPWLHAVQAALPTEKLTENGRADLQALLAQGGITGIAAGLLTSLTEGPTGLDCLLLFPASGANESYVMRWRKTDMSSEPISGPSYRCWLWTTEDDAVYPCAHGFGESGIDNWRGHIRLPDDLSRALRFVD